MQLSGISPVITVCKNSILKSVSGTLKGDRIYMEDAHFCHLDDQHSLFGVFDGYNGFEVAKDLKDNYKDALFSRKEFKSGDYKEALTRSFIEFDKRYRNDDYISRIGSSALISLITPEKKLYVANLGTSEAILGNSKRGQFVEMSNIHMPEEPTERARIEKAGGKVINSRTEGRLALSRAFGLEYLKADPKLGPAKQMLSCVPEIKMFNLLDAKFKPKFLFMASRGVRKSNKKIAEHVHGNLADGSKCLETLLKSCDYSHSSNMTAILVTFSIEK